MKPTNNELRLRRCSRGRVSMWMLVIVVLLLLAGAFLFWPEHDRARQAAEPLVKGGATTADKAAGKKQRKVKYWRAPMDPNYISDKPGKSPMGMDLIPVYEDKPDMGSGSMASGKQGAKAGRKVKYWRAPMDPNYISDKPGKSPMGMDLIPVYEDDVSTSSGNTISISPTIVQNMGVRTGRVELRRLVRTIRTVGTVDYDEPLVREVTTKFDGWIEKLYADYTGQYIEKGKPLFSVYSRELYSTQEEYLLALRNQNSVRSRAVPSAGEEMKQLVESTRLRLRLFDISDDQIAAIERRGKPSKALTILSPNTGVITEKAAREGMHITPGTKLYTIADLSRVWVYVDIYENEVPFVKIGQNSAMDLSYLPGQVFQGRVVYVYPVVTSETRTVKVRLEFANPHLLLKPGMFANVEIKADLGREAPVVPRSAVIDTGKRKVAFVARGHGRFEPRRVEVGVDVGNDSVEVIHGLNAGENVVVSGQFLLDSESKLREAVMKMIERRSGSNDAGLTTPTVPATQTVPAETAGLGPGTQAAVQYGSLPELAGAAKPVIEAYLKLQGILANDDSQRVVPALQELAEPLNLLQQAAASSASEGADYVARAAGSAVAVLGQMRGRSLDSVRAQFVELSAEIIAIVRIVGTDHLSVDSEQGLVIFHCPMAGADWLQAGNAPANPFYGLSMMQCGDPVELAPETTP